MRSPRFLIFAGVGAFALIAGMIFALPFVVIKKEYTRLDINGTALIAEVVADDASRARGLSGRDGLGSRQGMLFVFGAPGQYSIWMKDMKFPIDILWIKDGHIVDMEERVPPPARIVPDELLPVYTPEVNATYVLEVPSGFAERYHVKIGDAVGMSPAESRIAEIGNVVSALTKETVSIGAQYFIDTLREHPVAGKDFRIIKKLSETSAYGKYAISYMSGNLTITGIMNIPLGDPPKEGYPVLILNHGLIHASVYFSGRGSKREQDFFASHGYVTIHPDYRGLADSSPNPDPHHDFYVGYTQDVVAAIDAIKGAGLKTLDTNRIGMWGHSMGGGIAARVMVLRPDIRAFVLFAPISADVEDNFYELSQDELDRLARTYGVGKAARVFYDKMSPLNYFSDVQAPVQLHHGLADTDVPIEFSEKMYSTLTSLGKKAEIYKYPGQKHEFIEGWQLAANRSLQFFDKYVKNTR